MLKVEGINRLYFSVSASGWFHLVSLDPLDPSVVLPPPGVAHLSGYAVHTTSLVLAAPSKEEVVRLTHGACGLLEQGEREVGSIL